MARREKQRKKSLGEVKDEVWTLNWVLSDVKKRELKTQKPRELVALMRTLGELQRSITDLGWKITEELVGRGKG